VLVGFAARTLTLAEAQCSAVAILASDDASQIERQCAMNRKILDKCAVVTGANIMSEGFAQNILQQMVQAECDRQSADWQARNGPCAKAFEDFQRKMEVYQADTAKYAQDGQAYSAVVVPTPPSCEMTSQPTCDTGAIQARILSQAEARARESLATTISVRRRTRARLSDGQAYGRRCEAETRG
jgi:hypothetical protein